MKKHKGPEKKTDNTGNNAVYLATDINTCISCGREIPEGMIVCMDCEVGKAMNRCEICDRPISELESICSNCKAIMFRSENKDQDPDTFAILGEEKNNA